MGLASLTWYPDPVRFGYKGTMYEIAYDMAYNLQAMRKPVIWSTLVLGTFSAVECLTESLRDPERESTYVNAFAGGAAAGAVMGTMTKRFDIMSVTALSLGILMGMIEYNGQRTHDPEIMEKKLSMRITFEEEESSELQALKEKYPKYKHL